MRTATPQGFTLLEVMIASLLFTAGIGALLGTAALTIRLTVRGRQATRAMEVATAQLEAVRAEASRAPNYCGGLTGGADSTGDGTRWHWEITSGGALREASVVVSVPVPGGWATDTLPASLWCP